MRKDLTIGLRIKEAITKNVCHPTAGEEKRFTVSKLLRTSTSREGDSEVGLILFCGIADELGLTTDEIVIILSVDAEEARFKIKRYSELIDEPRFKNKIKLVKNYLKLKYGITS